MPLTIDQLNALDDIGTVTPFQSRKAAPKKRGNFLTNMLPTAGGIGGGVVGGAAGGALAGTAVLPGVGTAVGGLLGALLGAGAGGAAGKLAENTFEGNSLGDGVAKEAALQGVLGAGPIRLAKGAIGAARALKNGTSLLETLNATGTAAARPSAIKTMASNSITDTKNAFAAKALGLSKGQKNTILEKTGDKAGAIAERYGIKNADDIPKALQPLYDDFSATVTSIPKTFSKEELRASFQKAYGPLLAKGTPLGQQSVGKALKAEADNILRGVKAPLTAAELNAKRQAFDKLAYSTKATDPTAYNVNKQARDILSGLVKKAADDAGVTGSTTGMGIRELGKEINKLERLAKAANKNIEGTGGMTALGGIGTLPGAVLGGTVGPAGAVAGIAANAALNSGAGRRAVSALADKSAGRLTASAGRDPYSLTSVAKRVAPLGLLGALGQSSSTAMNSESPITAATMPNTSNIDPEYANASEIVNTETSTSPFDAANVEANAMAILKNGGDMKDVTQYVSLVQALQEMKAPVEGNKPLNSTQQQQASNAMSGLESLETIAQTLQRNPNAGKLASLPGGSLTANLTGTGEYKAAIANATDVIGRLRSGGAIQKDEERRFLSLLPQPFDDPETANYKLGQVARLFQRFANPQPAAPDTASLAGALGI